MTDAQLIDRYVRRMTMVQELAMLRDDVERIRSTTWRALVRLGLARTVREGKNVHRVFTPLGRRLRAAMRNRDERNEEEYQRAVGGTS